jgi:hypothetical protein
MNPLSRMLAASAAVLATTLFAASPEPGAVELGSLPAAADGEFVEINLQAGILGFAARVAAKQEPQAAEVLRNLKSVRVNVVPLDTTTQPAALARVAELRKSLEADGWTPMVKVRGKQKEDVSILVKQRTEEAIDGLVLTVVEDGKQLVFVNIVGDIKADQLAEIGSRLQIEALKKAQPEPTEKG